jgi:hypothetical protein
VRADRSVVRPDAAGQEAVTVELSTPFAGTAFSLPTPRGWNPASTPLAAPPTSGCVGCPDWTGPAAPWQSTRVLLPTAFRVSGLPTVDLRS